MDFNDLEQLLELLCEFNCTYVLDSANEETIDRAINIVDGKMWQEVQNNDK